jgi:hypothetical protein
METNSGIALHRAHEEVVDSNSVNLWFSRFVINTGTTIVTFLVVFLIQNTQNRDAKALHLELDELIRSHVPARNDMIDIEKLSDEELEELERRYAAICDEPQIPYGGGKLGTRNKTTLRPAQHKVAPESGCLFRVDIDIPSKLSQLLIRCCFFVECLLQELRNIVYAQ